MSEEKAAFEGILRAAYPDEKSADEVLEGLKEAKKQKSFHYWDAAVIRKDERGRYYYKETSEDEATAVVKKLTADISEHMVHEQKAAYLITAAGRSISCHQLDASDETAKLLGI